MIPQNPELVHTIPHNLRRAFTEFPWEKLDPTAIAMLAKSAVKCRKHELYYIAYEMATVYNHRNVVERALALWAIDNKDLDNQVQTAVRTAFQDVYGKKSGGEPVLHVELKQNHLRVFKALLNLEVNSHEPFEVSYAKLVEESGLSESTVKRIVKTLVDDEVIEICKGGALKNVKGSPANVYRIPETTYS